MNPSDKIPPKLPDIELQPLGKKEHMDAPQDPSQPFVTTLPATLSRPKINYRQMMLRLKEFVKNLPINVLILFLKGLNSVISPIHNYLHKRDLEKTKQQLEREIHVLRNHFLKTFNTLMSDMTEGKKDNKNRLFLSFLFTEIDRKAGALSAINQRLEDL